MTVFLLLVAVVAIFALWRRTARLDREVAALRREVLDIQKREYGPAPSTVVEPSVVAAPKPEPIPQPVVATPPPPVPVVLPPPKPAGPTWSERIRSALDLEQMLGSNWLSKIGVAILVLGIAFFLAWQLRELGPAGKILVGTIVSAALLGAGVWGERSDRYRILGRAALAGGWALLFFVSFAAHQIPAARVIRSPLAGYVVMLAVVIAMVMHTLRFQSQVVTGLAFSIAFTTIALNRVAVYGLTGNVVLAIGFSLVVLRMRWYRLEILGIFATYINHYLWLIPIISPMGGHAQPFPQFYASATILILYWAIFRASYVIREGTEEDVSALAGVLNTALLLVVMKYQSAHPELIFRALLAMGAVELILSRLPIVRRKRLTFLVLTTLGVVLVGAAIPFRYAAGSVSPLWLIESALLVVVGILTNERIYRRLGLIGGIATATQIVAWPGARLVGMRIGGAAPSREWIDGTIFLAAMLAFYAVSEWVPRKWPVLFEEPVDRRFTRELSYIGALMGLLGAYAMCLDFGAAVCWALLGLALTVAGRRLASFHLMIEGSLLGGAAILRVLAVNLPSNAMAAGHVSWRLLTVSAVIAFVYAIAFWTGKWSPAATWSASGVLALLAWYEFLPISVAVAWAISALILLEVGVTWEWRHLRFQAYAMLAGAFVRVFVVNMNAAPGPRLYTVIPIVLGFLFAYERVRIDAFAWLAATTVVALLRFQVAADAVAIAWAALTLLLVAFAKVSARRAFLHIAEALAVATVVRAVIHNLYERSYFPPPATAPRWLLVSIVSALLFAALPFAFRLKRGEATNVWQWIDGHPEQILFFPPLLLVTILLGTEMRLGMLTVAWGVEAVAVFLFALWVGERSYRLSGLALLMLCVGKIFVFDFWRLSLRDKALTGIIVGAALIGVSILYTRKRDAILQFL
ncbi:MAG TPA: DUF2339 domain-containing protein [Thermoanaerobaculia bacterium]|nr:DUF2339 domain-containing protein [Thermoanaerobaculia bacterium]